MNNSDFSLQSYLKCLINIGDKFSTKNEKIVKSMTKIASCWFDIGFIRWYHIKEIRRILINFAPLLENRLKIDMEEIICRLKYKKICLLRKS